VDGRAGRDPSRRAVDQLLASAGGGRPVPWEFEGLATILSLVARGIGIAALPRLVLAAGERRVAVRELPVGTSAWAVYAVARASSVNRSSVSVNRWPCLAGSRPSTRRYQPRST
jgi:DNA-binding transcriptional LysR family regulator